MTALLLLALAAQCPGGQCSRSLSGAVVPPAPAVRFPQPAPGFSITLPNPAAQGWYLGKNLGLRRRIR